jgi:HSP20 family protein
MLMPVMRNSFFEDFLKDFPMGFAPAANNHERNQAGSVMKTDIKEDENGFDIVMDLPGFKKENVKAQIRDGYLVIQAETRTDNEEKDDKGKYLRRERYYGNCQRSFYVGDEITEEDIKARFEDGVLNINIPKKEKQIEEPKYVAIEG